MHLKRERIGFIVDRPNGTDDFVFLHFINPVDIRTGNRIIRTAPHACAIYTPHAPCYYESVSHEMFHDWLHFMPLSDEYNPLYFGLPLNKVFYTEFGSAITKEMENIQWLYNVGQPDNASENFFNLLQILKKESQLHHKSPLYSSNASFEELRFLIYQTPKNWNIQSMADYVHLSRSRFSIKYKELFGITPIADLGNAAMCMAEKLLTTTTMTVQNIASECGYDSTQFFINKFKIYAGTTPNVFRMQNSDN